ncbi:MAG: aspartate aminotransferase family protein [Myxococcota bacterium]|nr:aspartate aminotransferase family protein [Myxococcota bacterium]
MKSWSARAAHTFTPNYRPAPLLFTRGDGVYLYSDEGQGYLDFAAGIAVCALGHNSRRLSEAIAEQARSLLHVSNLYLNQPSIELAEALCARSFADRVYFGNSGAEANEAALKLARRYMRLIRGEDRWRFICAEKSFHGRTWAAISATGQAKYHEGFAPLVPGFEHVPYNDLSAVEAAINDETCAVFVEPMQGEGGVIAPIPGYLEGLRALCDQAGILLIFDEVQTGVGRTGAWFSHQLDGATPDIMTLAKGLGGGVPIGAMLCTDEVAQGFAPGAHASTFGGNPLACRAGLTVLEVIEEESLLDQVRQRGQQLEEALSALVSAHSQLLDVRGRGLLRGIGCAASLDRARVVTEARERGLLITTAGADALRLCPPLVIGEGHIREAMKILDEAIQASVD